MNGGSSASYLAYPCFVLLLKRGGNRWVFRLPGEGGDHFHCTVEPSPGHIRCRVWGRVQVGGGGWVILWKLREKGNGGEECGGVGTGMGTGKSFRMHLSKLPFGKLPSSFETFIACIEADFENRPCARENCAKLVRAAFSAGLRKFVRKMCGGIRKCAEIVRNLCGGAPAQFAQSIGVGLPRMCVHKFRAMFRHNLNSSLRPSCTGKKCLKSSFGWVFLTYSQVFRAYDWSWLLTVNWLGLFYLRLKLGSVFCCLRSYFLLTVPPPSRNRVWSVFAYGSPTARKRQTESKKTSTVSKKRCILYP